MDPEKRFSADDALDHPWITNESDEPIALHAVVNRMNQRKSILLTEPSVKKVMGLPDLYPKGDYSEMLDKLCKYGLDPMVKGRERRNSDTNKSDLDKVANIVVKQRRIRK